MTLRARAALAAIVALFVGSAMLFVSRPGIEADEAVVTGAGNYTWFSLPVMHFSYVGALKTWFYLALFSFVKPSQVSLRVPTVLAAASAIWLFFVLLDRTIGRRAAWIGALLLATDSMFVILNALDFGPNALHFVFKLGAMVLLLRFHRDGSRWALAAAFFLIGLALWDKAIFIWAVFGVSLATLIVFPREVRQHLSIRNLGIAAASAIVGALPLIAYNIHRPFDTFHANAHMTREPIRQKIGRSGSHDERSRPLRILHHRTASTASRGSAFVVPKSLAGDFGDGSATHAQSHHRRVMSRLPGPVRTRLAQARAVRIAGLRGNLAAHDRHRRHRRRGASCHSAMAVSFSGDRRRARGHSLGLDLRRPHAAALRVEPSRHL